MASERAVCQVLDHKEPALNEPALVRIQAAFEAPYQGKLVYKGVLGQQNLYHLTRLVAKKPTYLQHHTRRIFLCINCRNRPALIGALVDLFLVLRGRGSTLYARLLEQSAGIIGNQVRRSLEKAFEDDDVKRVMRLPLEHSVLANGRDGSLFRPAKSSGSRS